MVGGQPAETWRQLCPSQPGSQGTAAFLLRVKFPFPGFVFSAASEINIDTAQSKQSPL